MTNSLLKTKKLITFTKRQETLANKRAGKLGLSFPEYIRHLIAKDTDMFSKEIKTLSPEEIIAVGKGIDNIERGEYTVVRTKEELQKHLDSI